jgi:YegS/Rv2252/BmrU family lipid kinase
MSRRGIRRRARVLRVFKALNVEAQELRTERPGHARDVLHARETDWDAVFTLGGDGTVMEVVGALAHSGIPIGVLPGGTGNLVAGVLGVPRNVKRAVHALLNGRAKWLDVGRLPDGKCFTFAAGVGVDVAMVERTTHGGKRVLGMLSYALTATRAALGRETVNATIEVDGRQVQGRVLLAMIANAGSILGGRFTVGPDVKPDDGELDLCLFMPGRRRDVVSLMWRLFRNDFRPHAGMQFIRGKRFVLASDPPVSVQADGDIVGHTPIEIVVDPGAALFLVPRSRP